ncbi:MAG TPA: hypothetical protein VGH32_00875, partial [Pirellulales bacterium]
MNALLPAAQSSRELGRTLVAQAMLRIQQGKFDAAFEDSLACHRLGRLVGQGPTLVEALVGITLDQMGDNVDEAIVGAGRISAAQARMFADELRKLPSMPDIAEKVNWSDRLMLLDTIVGVMQDHEFIRDSGVKNRTLSDEINQRMVHNEIDLNQALRNANMWHDRMVGIAREPPGLRRRQDLDAFNRDIRALNERLAAAEKSHELASMSSAELSHYYADKLVVTIFPAADGALIAKDRAVQRLDLVRIAYALAGYRADRQSYPAKLNELVPSYIGEIPK